MLRLGSAGVGRGLAGAFTLLAREPVGARGTGFRHEHRIGIVRPVHPARRVADAEPGPFGHRRDPLISGTL